MVPAHPGSLGKRAVKCVCELVFAKSQSKSQKSISIMRYLTFMQLTHAYALYTGLYIVTAGPRPTVLFMYFIVKSEL